MKVIIEFEPFDGDPDHEMGLTNSEYEAVVRALSPYGDIIEIRKEDG